jgi:hypothetical protein
VRAQICFPLLFWNDGTCTLSVIDKFVLISHEAGWLLPLTLLLLLLLQNDK